VICRPRKPHSEGAERITSDRKSLYNQGPPVCQKKLQIQVAGELSLSLEVPKGACFPAGSTQEHINVLELLAVFLALRHFLPVLRNRYVLVRTDNYMSAGPCRDYPTCSSAMNVEPLCKVPKRKTQ
jgi:hypothetical protein